MSSPLFTRRRMTPAMSRTSRRRGLVILGPMYPHVAKDAKSPAREQAALILQNKGAGPGSAVTRWSSWLPTRRALGFAAGSLSIHGLEEDRGRAGGAQPGSLPSEAHHRKTRGIQQRSSGPGSPSRSAGCWCRNRRDLRTTSPGLRPAFRETSHSLCAPRASSRMKRDSSRSLLGHASA